MKGFLGVLRAARWWLWTYVFCNTLDDGVVPSTDPCIVGKHDLFCQLRNAV